MNNTNDDLWLAFEALGKSYPHDDGVRMTADLARWLLQERQRINESTPTVIDRVVRNLTQASLASTVPPSRTGPTSAE